MASSTYISLFAGGAGLDLGLRIALPEARCVCYVERDGSPASILATRIKEGTLDDAPIWADVRTFPSELYRGRVAGIIGGFPCQDLSVAGKRAGIDGAKSGLWAEYARIIRDVRPDWVFIENVSGLLDNEPMRRVLGDLSGLGFDAEWLSLRASDVGASHGRKRIFILADSERGAFQRWRGPCIIPCAAGTLEGSAQQREWSRNATGDLGKGMANAGGGQLQESWRESERRNGARSGSPDLGNAAGGRLRELREPSERERLTDGPDEVLENAEGAGLASKQVIGAPGRNDPASAPSGELPLFAYGPNDPRWRNVLVQYPWLRPSLSQAEAESIFRGVADGLAALVADGRTSALRTLGNGVVPLQAAVAFVVLARRVARR